MEYFTLNIPLLGIFSNQIHISHTASTHIAHLKLLKATLRTNGRGCYSAPYFMYKEWCFFPRKRYPKVTTFCRQTKPGEKHHLQWFEFMAVAQWLCSAPYTFLKYPPHWGQFVVGKRNSVCTCIMPRILA